VPKTLSLIAAAPLTGGRGVFTRILVGIDGSQAAREAARQAAVLGDVDGEMTLMAVWDLAPPVVFAETGGYAGFDPDARRAEAEHGLSDALGAVAAYASPIAKLVRGLPTRCLLEEIDRDQDTLVALGARGTGGRLLGMLGGSTASELVHDSPCSVLVARGSPDPFPRSIVVGIDGSPESAAAFAASRYLSRRFDAELIPLVAGGGDIDERLVGIILGEHYDEAVGDPVEVLTEAAADADLLVVGSRGLRGLKAIGSVSERVAHEAACSVLIVREPPWQRVREELTL